MDLPHNVHEFPDAVILLAAAVLIVALFRQFRLSPVLGFLVAGAAIGPHGFSLIHDIEGKSYLAEFGVVMLLFVIGLELSFKKLREMRIYVLGLGSLQMLVTAALIAWIVHDYLGMEIKIALFIGAALALSSTAIVLQVLDEHGERITQVGRVSFSALLLQDLAVIPLLILVPILSGNGTPGESLTTELTETAIKAIIAIIALLTIGKLMLKPVLSLIAGTKSSELFVATTLLLVLGGSYITEQAGLSMALGAFIAGLMLSETEFRKQVEVDIMPFKGLLLGLFFMTVGMHFDLLELINRFPLVALLSISLIVVKTIVVMLICLLFRMDLRTGLKTGILLSQGSEFAFILFNLATHSKLIPDATGQMLLLVVSFTMALTPLIFTIITFYYNRIKRRKGQKKLGIKETSDLKEHFVICGFGWVAENLARVLASENYNFVAIDSEPKPVKMGREKGFPVYYGDATRIEILNSLKIKNARAAIVTMHDTVIAIRVITAIRKNFPLLPIIARTKRVDHIDSLRKAGASVVIPEAYESSIQIAKVALKLKGISDFDIELILNNFRDQVMLEDMA